MSNNTIPAAQAIHLASLINATEQGIASQILTKTSGGNLTLFSFDKGKDSLNIVRLDAIVMVIEGGELILTVDGKPVKAEPGTIVRMPANIPHTVEAPQAAKMLLIMLREIALKNHKQEE